MKKAFSPLVLIIPLYLYLAFSTLFGNPLVWPDETVYADIARNIILEGRLGTDLLKGMIPGFESHSYWSPPLFMYSLAGWFKIFGFSILNQRLFSVFLGAIAIALFYAAASKLSRLKKPSYIFPATATLLLVIDQVFLKASRISRPEILVLAFTAAAFLIYLKSFDYPKPGKQNIFLFLCGLLLSLALVTHMLALCFALALFLALIISRGKDWLILKNYYFFILGIILPTAIRLLSIYPHYSYLLDQLNLISNSSNYTLSLYIYITSQPFPVKMSYLINLLVSAGFIIFTLLNRTQGRIALALILIFSWIFTFVGSIQWYLAYPVFFSYLALFVMSDHYFSLKKKHPPLIYPKLALTAACLSLLYFNLSWFYTVFSLHKSDDYQIFSRQITDNIPPGKTVYLSSLPDAYYPLSQGRNKLYTYPTFTLDMIDYQKILDDTDYLVFNNFYSPPSVSEYAALYLNKNIESMIQINEPYQYAIIKLKDKNLRTP